MSDNSEAWSEEAEEIPYEEIKICPCCGATYPRQYTFTPQPILSEELWQAIKARMNREQAMQAYRQGWTPGYQVQGLIDPTSTTGQRVIF